MLKQNRINNFRILTKERKIFHLNHRIIENNILMIGRNFEKIIAWKLFKKNDLYLWKNHLRILIKTQAMSREQRFSHLQHSVWRRIKYLLLLIISPPVLNPLIKVRFSFVLIVIKKIKRNNQSLQNELYKKQQRRICLFAVFHWNKNKLSNHIRVDSSAEKVGALDYGTDLRSDTVNKQKKNAYVCVLFDRLLPFQDFFNQCLLFACLIPNPVSCCMVETNQSSLKRFNWLRKEPFF